jgi:hypothetical protein
MSSWEKDWDNPDDAVYDGPDEEQIAAAKKRKAMREYMEWSAQLQDELIAEMGQEAYDASQHWINNPLIKPVSKVAMFEEWEARIRREQNERIIKLLEEQRRELMEQGGITEAIIMGSAIELIKGETK